MRESDGMGGQKIKKCCLDRKFKKVALDKNPRQSQKCNEIVEKFDLVFEKLKIFIKKSPPVENHQNPTFLYHTPLFRRKIED